MGPTSSADGRPTRGVFRQGMEFVTWGWGPRTLLFLPGGPGSVIPTGGEFAVFERQFRPLVDAGYAVWLVTRRRHMPAGHTLRDMADDYAQVIADELGGRVDLVVGTSFGGMIAQHLAAAHPGRFGHLAMVAAGCEVSPWGVEVDRRLGTALAAGDRTEAGMALAEYVLPGERTRWLRRLAAPAVAALMLPGDQVPPEDLLTELRAEEGFDTRRLLGDVERPVLLAAGDRDRFFPPHVIAETATLIPECTLVWYPGWGHVRTAASRKISYDVLAFVDGAGRQMTA